MNVGYDETIGTVHTGSFRGDLRYKKIEKMKHKDTWDLYAIWHINLMCFLCFHKI